MIEMADNRFMLVVERCHMAKQHPKINGMFIGYCLLWIRSMSAPIQNDLIGPDRFVLDIQLDVCRFFPSCLLAINDLF